MWYAVFKSLTFPQRKPRRVPSKTMAMLMSALRTFAPRSDSAIETPDSQILHHDHVSQPGDEIDGLSSSSKEVGCARDKHETTSEVVVEAPERHDVLEHCVFKCFGAYPNMQSTFISTSAIIEKHWAKKSQILVHPVELKQAEFRDGPVCSTGMAELIRLPFGAGGVAWETGRDEIDDKILRLSADISNLTREGCACPLVKGGRHAAKANYVWAATSAWLELSDAAKMPGMPKECVISYSPDGIERCSDFSGDGARASAVWIRDWRYRR